MDIQKIPGIQKIPPTKALADYHTPPPQLVDFPKAKLHANFFDSIIYRQQIWFMLSFALSCCLPYCILGCHFLNCMICHYSLGLSNGVAAAFLSHNNIPLWFCISVENFLLHFSGSEGRFRLTLLLWGISLTVITLLLFLLLLGRGWDR